MSGAPDVAVIGAGIVGVSVAERLAVRGVDVTVYERAGIAAAASGRNSGVVQHPLDPALVGLHLATLDRYRRLADEEPTMFRLGRAPSGLLLVAHEADGVRALANELARTHPQLHPAFLGPGEATRLEPALAQDVAACRLEIGYPVAPASATRAIAARAAAAGATFRIGSTAAPRIDGERAIGVTVDGTFVPAGSVVVAAGPWSPDLVDPTGSWRPIRPLWGVVVEVELSEPPGHVLEEAGIDVAAGRPVAGDDDGAWEVDFSLVTAGGTSSLGSTFLDLEPDAAAVVPRLVEHGASFVPAIESAPRGPSRACARPLSIDGRPLIGRVPGTEGLWIVAGHGPWGVSTGPASGALLADLLLGTVVAPPPALDVARFGGPRAILAP